MQDTLNSVNGLQVNMDAGDQTVSSLRLLMQAMMVMNAILLFVEAILWSN
jgi:hypothetical protein